MNTLQRRLYDLELLLFNYAHYVGNELGGDTDTLDEATEELREIREALEAKPQ